jgi:hypothetical protein
MVRQANHRRPPDGPAPKAKEKHRQSPARTTARPLTTPSCQHIPQPPTRGIRSSPPRLSVRCRFGEQSTESRHASRTSATLACSSGRLRSCSPHAARHRPAEAAKPGSPANALLAQLVEHFHGKEGVVGSSPTEGLGFLPAQGLFAGAGSPTRRSFGVHVTSTTSTLVDVDAAAAVNVSRRLIACWRPSLARWP